MNIAEQIISVANHCGLQPSEVQHLVLSNSMLFSTAVARSVLAYKIDQSQCLLVRKIELCSIPSDAATATPVYSERQSGFYAEYIDARAWWRRLGDSAELTPRVPITNIQGECFLSFSGGQLVSLMLYSPTETIERLLFVRIDAFLLPSKAARMLTPNATRFIQAPAGALSTAASPATLADEASVGDVAWTDPGNAASSNDTYATSALTVANDETHYLKATNFGFAIPTGAVINGILAEVEGKGSVGGVSRWMRAHIVKGGVIGAQNKGYVNVDERTPLLETVDEYQTFGGAADLWGEAFTAADINAATFGVVFAAGQFDNTVAGVTISLDHVRLTVYYTI